MASNCMYYTPSKLSPGQVDNNVHPYIWREAFATAFADNGRDAEQLRVFMKWSSKEMAGVYVNSRLKRLQKTDRHVGPVDRMMLRNGETMV